MQRIPSNGGGSSGSGGIGGSNGSGGDGGQGTNGGSFEDGLTDWTRPPRMIAGHVAGPMLVARNDRVVVAVRQVLAYPSGIEITAEAHVLASAQHRPTDQPGDHQHSDHQHSDHQPSDHQYSDQLSGQTDPDDLDDPDDPSRNGVFWSDRDLRFRVRCADGAEAVQDDDRGLRTGAGPVLTACHAERSSGPDGRESLGLTLWLWPLPPPGPLMLVAAWPGRGLPEGAVTLDGEAIRAAAAAARPFWTEA